MEDQTINPRINKSDHQAHCVVLTSGGIDSAACIDFYQRQQFAVSGLHVNYGQPAARMEDEASSSIAKYYGISLVSIELTGARAKPESEFLGRNAFFVFTALLELRTQSAVIALGIHSGTPYFDCSPSFISRIQKVVDGQCDGRVRVVAPFLEWSKKEIWAYCLDRKVPIHLTYSCERGLSIPCGACLSCKDLEALRAC